MNKMIEKLDNAVFSKDYIVYEDSGSDIVSFSSNDLPFNTFHLNNINLDGDKFDDYDPKAMNYIKLVA